MRPTISTPFAIPVGISTCPSAASLNPELKKLFLEREAMGAEYSNSRATMQLRTGIFESRFDLFRWPEPCVRALREFCWNQLYQFVAEVNQFTPDALGQIQGHADAWFHVTRRGGYFGLHNHPMASWSAVYCVDAAQSGSEFGGLLAFPPPNGAMGMYVDVANRQLKMPFSQTTREYRLDSGQLLLFPSWLMHQVTPYFGSGERITVAFNAWFQPRSDQPA